MATDLTTNYDTLFAEPLAQINQALQEVLAFETLCHHQPQQASNDIANSQVISPQITGPQITGLDQLWLALRYSILAGGKRIRAVLALEVCQACGGQADTMLPTACAIELVHAQSLIHDDLPCMDNDDLRRGQPTLHKAFNEATAVLAGDALLAYAFGLIARQKPWERTSGVTAETLLQVLSEFSDVASIKGLVNGQFVDIYYENRPFDETVLEYIHTYKTAALFRFSVRAGVLLSGQQQFLQPLSEWGYRLGLAFQIVDDLLDIEAASSEQLGKTPGKDEASHKATYPALYGRAHSRQILNTLASQLHQQLAELSQQGLQQPERLGQLAQFVLNRLC